MGARILCNKECRETKGTEKKNTKGKKPNNQTTERVIIMYLENEKRELKEKIMEMEQQSGTTAQNKTRQK